MKRSNAERQRDWRNRHYEYTLEERIIYYEEKIIIAKSEMIRAKRRLLALRKKLKE